MAQDTVYVASTTPGPNLTPVTSDITLANAVVAASAARDAAQASQTAAAASATTASTKAGEASASATAADGSKTAAAASASLSQSYAIGFSIGTVVTLAPGSSATASITGLPGAQTLNLGLPQGAAGVGDMLKADNLSGLGNTTTARTNLGLGTAATKNTGTSGNTVPLLDGANTWSAKQTISGPSIPLDIISPVAYGPQIVVTNNANDTTSGYLLFQKQRSGGASASGDSIGMIFARAYNGSAWVNGPYINFSQASSFDEGDVSFSTGASGVKLWLTIDGPRVAAGKHLNWGATSGSTGYGLRDNAGVIEAKNSGGAWTPVLASAAVQLTTRQTVFSGPVDASGFPSFLPATSATLSITTQNVTGSAPLGVSAAQGFGATGKLDYASQFTANQTWSGLTASSTLFLYVNAQTGALGFTSLAPIYQHGGTPAVTNGQFTFNISEMKGYLGNGTTAPATPLVFVGEVVTNGTGVTSSIAYAYNGRYDSGWTATLPAAGTLTSKNSAIGVGPHRAWVSLQCTTADNGYAVGDNMELAQSLGSMRTTSFWTTFTSGGGGVSLPNKSTGASALLTAASWKWRIVAERGW